MIIDHFAFSAIVTSVTTLLLGILVLLNGRWKRSLYLKFAFYSFSITLWCFCVSIFGVEFEDPTLLWGKLLHVGALLIPIFFVQFISEFLGLNNKKIRVAVNIIGGAFILLNLSTRLVITGVVNRANYSFPATGPLYVYVFAFFAICTIYGIGNLAIAYVKASGVQKQKIGYLLFSSIFGYVGGLKSFMIIPGWEIFPIYPYGTYAIPIYTLLVAYAIIRHQLMDIQVIIKKTIVFAGLFLASYTVLVSFAYLGSTFFENITQSRWFAMVPSVLVIVVILRPLEAFLRNATDKYLFQKKYDYKELLKTFTNEVLTVLDLNELVNTTVQKLSDILKLENTSIFLLDEEGEEFKLAATTGELKEDYKIHEEEVLVKLLAERGFLVDSSYSNKGYLGSVLSKMKEFEGELVMPLLHSNNMIGILSFGKKKSDEEFVQDDIDTLTVLSKTLSIAIANALLFGKLSQAQAQAAQREKMAVIGTLSAGINHEICNPLGIARGQCEMFLLNLEEGVYKEKTPVELLDKASSIMKKVINETDRATTITKKLSSFAKPPKGGFENDVNIEKELDEVIALVEHDLKLDNILIVKDMEKRLPFISVDRKQVQEIFFNIIRNAVQAIKDSGTITIRAKKSNNRVSVDIEDSGRGMDKKELSQVFNPFYTTKEPGKGTGLGLFIVRQVANKNKGTVDVKSQPGKGTTVTLTFRSTRSEFKEAEDQKQPVRERNM